MIRAVVDTNVLVSGTISKSGPPCRIIEAWRTGLFTLITSRALIDEVSRVLTYPKIKNKYGLSNSQIASVTRNLETYSIVVPGNVKLRVIEDDPDDDRVLEAAVEAGADFIVSGDPHLKSLKTFEGIPVRSPAAFVKFVAQDQKT